MDADGQTHNKDTLKGIKKLMQHVFCSPHPALRKTPVAAALGIKRTRKGVNSIKRNKENKHRKKGKAVDNPESQRNDHLNSCSIVHI